MNRWEYRGMLAVGLAVIIPAVVLHGTCGPDRWERGLTAAPFAWPRLFVSHLITTVPLGLILARSLRTIPAVNEAASGVWWGAGVGIVGLAAVISPGLGEVLGEGAFGSGSLLGLRVLLAVLFVLPWCVWALEPREKSLPQGGLIVGVALGIALVPCAVYAEALISSRTQAAEEWMASGRYVKAERELTGLVELGSERPVAQKRPAELLPLLRKEIDRLQRTVEYPLPSTAAQRAKIARAEAWIQLEQLERAAEILEPLAPTDLNALLLLAVVNRDRQRWHESDANYHTALEQLLSQAQSDPSARERARLAFEGLAYNARQTHRRADAEQILRRAIAELPAEAARFHFLLGQHYASTGRPNQAIDHLTQAVELDPAKHRQTATELIRQLQSSTPSCLLR